MAYEFTRKTDNVDDVMANDINELQEALEAIVSGINKNIIINGGFTVNQRGYVSAATLAPGTYGHDRWKAGAGGGDYSFTQLASPTTITIAKGKTLIQVIENKNVIGGTYTLSWVGTAQGRYAVDSATPSGAYADSPITIKGQTAGTTMSVEFNEGTLGNVQLESGAVATAFDFRLYAEELALCQRYCYKANAEVAQGIFAFGQCYTTTNMEGVVNFPVTMRTIPSFTSSAAETFAIWGADAAVRQATSIAFDTTYSSSRAANIKIIIGAANLVAGNATMIIANSNINAFMLFTAEL